MKHIYIFTLLFFLAPYCNAQTTEGDPYFVLTTDTTSAYGPRNITRNILQDKYGNIWFASWEGIIRYDGEQFTNFTLKENLIKFHVFVILEDKNGHIWFGTIRGGVYRYDGTKFTLFTTADGLASNLVMSIIEDSKGNIWFGTDAGASKFDGKTFTNFTTNDGLANNNVYTMMEDNTGKIWFGTESGISRYESSAMRWTIGSSFTHFNDDKNAPFNNVRFIITDKTGNTWIGSQDGLFRYDGKVVTQLTTNFTGYVFEDKMGNIWLSEGVVNGRGMTLSKYDGISFTKITSNDNQIFGITEDTKGNIWFGTAVGICCYDGKSFNTYTK